VAAPWTEVGDRVHVRRYSTWHGEEFDQNIGLVHGSAGLLVIDTRASHRLADELIGEIRALTRAPVVGVINTHHHWDHTWGNARFLPAPIWGHARCAETLVERSRGSLQRVTGAYPSLAEELDEVEVTPPTRTLDDRATLDLGDRQVELRHLGYGHTDNDIVVDVPDAAVLFAGDLLENDAPPSFGDAYPIAWGATAARLHELVTGAVVPGHGSVGDGAFARRQAEELALVAELASRAAKGELDDDELLRRSPFPPEVTQVVVRRVRIELGLAEDDA
jgi:glyoxylase-like metal-dependent hydrolase (beta-lactamase superfamily II)